MRLLSIFWHPHRNDESSDISVVLGIPTEARPVIT
jgi:hypothetical protein